MHFLTFNQFMKNCSVRITLVMHLMMWQLVMKHLVPLDFLQGSKFNKCIFVIFGLIYEI